MMKAFELLNNKSEKKTGISEMQFGFMSGGRTTDAIFNVRQLQEKYLGIKKNLYFTFAKLEKAFNRFIAI